MIAVTPFEADRDLTGAYRLAGACHRTMAGDLPRPRFEEFAATLRHPAATVARHCWIAGDATEPDGFATLSLPRRGATGYCTMLLVHPRRRRRGIGRALSAAVRTRAGEAGTRVVQGWYGDDPAGAAFAAAIGGRVGSRLRQSMLRLPAPAPRPDLSAGPSGYRLRSWHDSAPEALLASYAAAREAINDAPHDDDVPRFRFRPESVRRLEATAARRGQRLHVTVATATDGTVAGFTELRIATRPDSVAFTTDTAVIAAHRGRGLAGRLKAERLRALADERPDVRTVVSTNDVTNAAMLAVNRAAGFRPVATQTLVYLAP